MIERNESVVWMSPERYAHKYDLHPESVRRMCRAGALPAKHVGSRWRIRDDDKEMATSAATPIA